MVSAIGKISLCIVAACTTNIAAVAQWCDASIMESKTQSLALLQRERDQRDDPECITFAIYGLRGSQSAEIVETLLKYLDFERPLTAGERHGIRREPISGEGGMYPAVASLSLLGQLAVPGLISVMSSEQESKLCHRNALLAFMSIYRSDQPKAVALLKAEALQKPNSKEGLRLMSAARDAVALCSAPSKGGCLQQLE